MYEIADPLWLRTHYGEISVLARRKVLHRLDRHARAFIALSPFVMLVTADADGHADASPRGDAPGFVKVRDDTTLLVPDRRGNNRVNSFANVLATSAVGLLFLVPGIDETLRVNGRARLLTGSDRPPGIAKRFEEDVNPIGETGKCACSQAESAGPDLLAAFAVHGKLPRALLEVTVQEVFFYCGKALKRAALWDPARHQPRHALPSLGRIIAEQTGAMDLEAADEAVAESDRGRLYKRVMIGDHHAFSLFSPSIP